MSSLPTPNFVLTEAVIIWHNGSDVTLDPGTFVRPINESYLPQHIKDKTYYQWSNKDQHDWCYCYLGIVEIPKDKMRKV